MNNNGIFITGNYRSGTTLLEKLLSNHSQVSICSQPLPFFYYKSKESFLRTKNLKRYYPLNTLFDEKDYRPQNFTDYLVNYKFNKDQIRDYFDSMQTYSGNYSKFLKEYSSKIHAGSLAEIHNQISLIASQHYKKERTKYIGTKEVLCEEFIQYYLNKNMKVVLVYRDPRSVITSVLRGTHMGMSRPVLFNIRNWRKSIAFKLKFENNPNFLSISYEELTNSLSQVLSQISIFLELEMDFPDFNTNGIQNQSGESWGGNSSFDLLSGVKKSNSNQFLNFLSPQLLQYIEFHCFPELVALNYKIFSFDKKDFNSDYFDELEFHEKTDHPISKIYLENSKENMILEKQRISFLLKENPSEEQKMKLYIFEEVYDKLKQALS